MPKYTDDHFKLNYPERTEEEDEELDALLSVVTKEETARIFAWMFGDGELKGGIN